MRKEIKRLHNGHLASVRDYEVQECIRKNENMDIFYEGEKMTLTPEQLKNETVGNRSPIMKSQYGKDYTLLNYLWQPEQMEL